MKVSVIIPCYNRRDLLSECLDSFRDAGGDFEIIVVDDGSEESLRPVVGRHRYVKVRHGGPAYARNIGIDLAHGDTIMFFDSDDLALPGLVDTRTRELEETGADYVYGDYFKQVRGQSTRYMVRVRENVNYDQLCHHQTIPFGGSIMRANVPRKVRFDESFMAADDWEFVLGVVEHGFSTFKGQGALWVWRSGDWERTTGSAEEARVLAVTRARHNGSKKAVH